MLIGIDANSRTLQWPPNLWYISRCPLEIKVTIKVIYNSLRLVTSYIKLNFLKQLLGSNEKFKRKRRAHARPGDTVHASARGRRIGQRADKVPTSSVA
jgi:hypothetical protein